MKSLKMFSVIGVFSLALLAGCGDETEEETGEVNYSEEVDYTVTGIEPGAGITEAVNETLDAYDNLDGWEQHESSTGGMMTELGQAIENEEPIVIAGWSPHHKFIQYDLKYLDDPEGSMGESEYIHTVTRNGLEDDMPELYQFLDSFAWEMEDMEQIMYDAEESSFEQAAESWIEDNQDLVDEWTAGLEEVDGEEVSLVSTPWESERASSEVANQLLSDFGYEVEVTEVDPAVVFESLATDTADASLAAWLPYTHGHFAEENEGDYEDLGPHVEGARLGIVVPEYMDIDSIEDLEPNE